MARRLLVNDRSRKPDIILGTTLETHRAIVIVQEPPNPLHPIGFLLCFQLVTFVQMVLGNL
jgi:hypothetical protein